MFSPEDTIVLEDERVVLRPMEISDLENLLHFSLNEPDIWRYSLIQADGEQNLLRYIRMALDARSAGREYPFIVFDKMQKKYAGSTRFYDIQLNINTLQLGYTWYGKDFRGTGLNRHCKFLLLQYAFENMNIERVEFRADVKNERSIAAMKGIGCTVEGVLRSTGPRADGGRRDSIVLSILKKEWEMALKQQLIKQLKT